MDSHWLKYYGPDGMFINKPPYGEIVALDIISGKIIWRSTWGYENTKNGIKNIGSLNNGGIALSSTGLIFANGTRDSYAMIFDAENGEELWKYKMEADGTAPPLIYEFNGKEYVSFLSTGSGYNINSNKKSSILYTFSVNE
jgi:quinoprotein glucose dehydrogenase